MGVAVSAVGVSVAGTSVEVGDAASVVSVAVAGGTIFVFVGTNPALYAVDLVMAVTLATGVLFVKAVADGREVTRDASGVVAGKTCSATAVTGCPDLGGTTSDSAAHPCFISITALISTKVVTLMAAVLSETVVHLDMDGRSGRDRCLGLTRSAA